MTIEALAAAVIDACESARVEHMLTGAFAFSMYGIPRSTKDVDVVLDFKIGDSIPQVVERLSSLVHFDSQVQFDTLTWGKRMVGTAKQSPPFKVELFELFDDPFVVEQFARKRRIFSPQLARHTWLPTPEDVVVQKLRWGRNKDLDDARDILAVQGVENLDMAYVEKWCAQHKTSNRLTAALAAIPAL